MKYRDFSLVKSLLFGLGLVLIAGVMTAYGQKVTGGLQGTVADESKAVIAGAEVVAKNVGTGAESSTTTNENGLYRFPAMTPGVYTISVVAPGFKRSEITQINVKLGVDSSLDVGLQVGGQTEVVEVTGGEVVIERETSQISQNYDARKVAELPNSVAGGGIDTIALLTPGVIAPDDAAFSNSNGTNISSNGGRGRSNNFTIDGQDNNDISVAGPSLFIDNPDAVQEFQIVTNNFSAEYGQSSGAIVNLITKGGTNDFHGSAAYYHRDRKLFSTLTSAERRSGKKEADPFLDSTFSYSIGGPVVKDKVFFFHSFQGIREAASFFTQSGSNGLTPTLNGIATLKQFADPAIANVLNFAPFNVPLGNPQIQPNVPARLVSVTIRGTAVPVEFSGIQRSVPTPFEENFTTNRVDWNINSKARLFGRYLYQKQESGNATGRFAAGYVVDVPARSQQLGATFIYQLSPRVVNETRFSYSRLRVDFGGNQLGNIPSSTSADQALVGVNQPAGFLAFGVQNNLPQGRLNDNYQFQNNISLVLGRHSLKAGVDVKRRLTDSNFLPNQNGTFTFTTLTRFAENNPNNASIAFGPNVLNFTETDQFYFFQDDLRLRDNLTLNVGIRYENSGQPINVLNELTTARESDATTAFFNPSLPLETRVVPKIDTDNNNFAPRFGFAYSPRFLKSIFGENKTVFRGGYGIAYDLAFYNILLNVSTATPTVLAATLAGAPGLFPSDPTGPGVRAALQPRFPFRQLNPNFLNQTRVANDFHAPYTQQFSFGLQRQFGDSTVLEARYVGTKSIGQFQSVNENPRIDAVARDFPQFLPPGVKGSPATPGCGNCTGRLIAGQALIRDRINGAISDYHALQVQFQTRLRNQLTLGAAYTFSKQLDNVSEIFSTLGGGVTNAFAQDPFDQVAGERSFGAFDVRNNFALNFIYDIPAFRAQKGVAGKLLGGYQLTGTYFARPGQKYTPIQFFFGSPYTDNLFNSGFIGILETLRPFIGNPKAPVGTVALDDVTVGASSPTGYFSLNALNTTGALVPVSPNDVRFIVNTAETAKRFGRPYGDAPRNTLLGDNLSRGNFGFFKNTKVGERVNIQFRAEFFNVFNHPNKGVPDPFVDDAGVSFTDVDEDYDGSGGGRRTIQFGLRIIF
jgi:outer membrane receptor protein involved in Fe transport